LPVLAAALIFRGACAASVIAVLAFVTALGLEYLPFGPMDQWPGFNWGRKRLLRFIHKNKIGNLVFLAGDLHISNFIELRARDDNAPPIYQFTSSPIANETKLNFIQRFFMFRDWIPFYRMARKSVFTESSLGTVTIRHPNREGCVLEHGLITESGAWKRMSRPITFA
jgi:phosphodiesterase/alkaline phosphatase D-like protein